MPAKHAILAVALCATGAALVAPRLHVQTTKLAARGRLLDELADLDGEAPVAVEETAPVAAPTVTEKAVLEPETLFFEGPPSKTELIVPGLSVLTVIGIVPFAAATHGILATHLLVVADGRRRVNVLLVYHASRRRRRAGWP